MSDHDETISADVAPSGPPDSRDVKAGYVLEDIRIKPIVISLIGLAVSVAVVQVFVVWFDRSVSNYVAADQSQEYGNDTRPHAPPREPRLQPNVGHSSLDHDDMAALRGEQEASLLNSGWVKDDHGQLMMGGALVGLVSTALSSGATTQSAPTTVPSAEPTTGVTPPATIPATEPSVAPPPKEGGEK